MNLKIISADNHVMEPPGTFVDRVPQALKERVPRFMKAKDGGEWWTWDGNPPAASPPPNTAPAPVTTKLPDGSPAAQLPADAGRAHDIARSLAPAPTAVSASGLATPSSQTGWTWDQLPRGNYIGADHLKDMARDDVQGALMYPGIAGSLYPMSDQEAKLAAISAYNDWLMDDFCADDPKRLKGVYLVPTDDSEADMLREAERVLAKGATALFLPMFPERPLFDPFYNPLWKLCSEAGIVASIHNFGGAVRPIPPIDGVDAATMRASRIVQAFFSSLAPLTNMVFAGVFERHPDLKFVAAEVNIGWVPYWVQQMKVVIEQQYTRGENWYPELPTRYPEEYIGKNIFFTVLADYVGFKLLKDDVRLARATMWSIDYPHLASLWGRSRELATSLTAPLDEETRQDVLTRTAQRLFKFGS
jgi:predicted TIM-barrel fold metal-dependent hydrolase